MNVHTELVGGIYDGKPIQLDGKTLPMTIEVPYFPNIKELLDVVNEIPTDDANQPISPYKIATYVLNNNGKYKFNG